jgi:uncharacterized protein (TIGR02246 family)
MKAYTIIGMTCVTTALAFGAPATADDKAGVLASLASAWDAAFNSGDADKVASMYAENGRVITGSGDVMVGPDEIKKLFQGFMDSGFGAHKIGVTTSEINGDTGYLTGTWSGVGGDGNDYGGHLANVYEKQSDGSWKAVVHIWN